MADPRAEVSARRRARRCTHVLSTGTHRSFLIASVVAVGGLVAGLLATPPAGAEEPGPAPTAAVSTTVVAPTTTVDIDTQQAELRKRLKDMRRRTDAVRADAADANALLAQTQARLAQQQATVREASEVARAANAAAEAAQTALADAEARAEASRKKVTDIAIAAYLHPPSERSIGLLASGSFTEMQHKQGLLGVTARQQSQVLAERKAAVAALRERQLAAADAAKTATAAADAQQAALVDMEQTRDAQADTADALTAQVGEQINATATLAAAEQSVSAQIAARDAATSTTRPQAPRPTNPPPKGSATTRPTTPPVGPTAPPTTAPTGTYVPPPLVGPGDVVQVGQLRVHRSIAPSVAALLMAGSAAGHNFGGGGYRDPASQVALRRSHCGPTDYDIYYRPASQCSPPTARPGTSMHEQGLAIDFTCSGVLITDHGDPCWVWLNANAASYGLVNLPSEPWHWSVNGR